MKKANVKQPVNESHEESEHGKLGQTYIEEDSCTKFEKEFFEEGWGGDGRARHWSTAESGERKTEGRD